MAFDEHFDRWAAAPVAHGPADCCDVRDCGADALVWVEFVVGQLSFCGHHWDEMADAAIPAVLRVTDLRREPLLPAQWLPEPTSRHLDPTL